MRVLMRWSAVILVLSAGWAAPPPLAQAANLDTTADSVFGQPDFTHNAPNQGGAPSASSLYFPKGVALDGQGNLYVADIANNRVLEYNAPLSSTMAASSVFGQGGSFTTATPNNGGISADSLDTPESVALDAQGNLYVADYGNNRVLEYDAPLTTDRTADRVFGQPSLITNTSNYSGINADGLHNPSGVALDGQGRLYVADTNNHRVLEYDAPLTTDRTADHVFGQPDFASNSPSLSASGMNLPVALALDVLGDLYAADYGFHRVLEYNAPLSSTMAASSVFGQGGTFTTTTPNKGGISADSLAGPNGLALDAQGDLYVADSGNSRVLEYDRPLSSGTTADHVLGQPSFMTYTVNHGGLSATSLAVPQGVAVDNQGNVYVADTQNQRVLEFDLPLPHGLPVLSALSPSTVARGSPGFTLTVNGSDFVASSVVRWEGSDRPTTYLNSTQLNASISAADVAAGGPFAVTVFTPMPGGGPSSLVNLTAYSRAGHDAVADAEQGQPGFTANSAENLLMPAANRLNGPSAVAVEAQSGRLFVAEPANNRVLSWPDAPAFANGQAADLVLGQPNLSAYAANNGGVSANSLSDPTGVALDALGDLFVADNGNHRVLEYSPPLASGMAASRVFGQGGSFTLALPNNGTVSANSLLNPRAVGLDRQGNLYVSDAGNHRVLEYDTPLSSGTTADRVFGQPDFSQNTPENGGVSDHSLLNPGGVALDTRGNLYVADTNHSRVLEFDTSLSADAIADRVFGQPSFSTDTANNNGLSAASLNYPQAVGLDGWGQLYVADTSNHRLLEYNSPLSGGTNADRVFGQPSFITNTANNGGVSASGLDLPYGLALDGQANLYVADLGNNRVLEFDWALVKIDLPLVRR